MTHAFKCDQCGADADQSTITDGMPDGWTVRFYIQESIENPTARRPKVTKKRVAKHFCGDCK